MHVSCLGHAHGQCEELRLLKETRTHYPPAVDVWCGCSLHGGAVRGIQGIVADAHFRISRRHEGDGHTIRTYSPLRILGYFTNPIYQHRLDALVCCVRPLLSQPCQYVVSEVARQFRGIVEITVSAFPSPVPIKWSQGNSWVGLLRIREFVEHGTNMVRSDARATPAQLVFVSCQNDGGALLQAPISAAPAVARQRRQQWRSVAAPEPVLCLTSVEGTLLNLIAIPFPVHSHYAARPPLKVHSQQLMLSTDQLARSQYAQDLRTR